MCLLNQTFSQNSIYERAPACYGKDDKSTRPAGDLDIRVLSKSLNVTELKDMRVPSQGRLVTCACDSPGYSQVELVSDKRVFEGFEMDACL